MGHVRPLLCLGQGRLRRCGFRAARVGRRSLHRCRWRPGLPLRGVRASRRWQRTIPATLGACWCRSSRDRGGSTDSGTCPIQPCVIPVASRSSSRGKRGGRIQVAETETEPRRGSLQCTRWGGETPSLIAAGRMIGAWPLVAVSARTCDEDGSGRCRRDRRIPQLFLRVQESAISSSYVWCGVTYGYPL